MFEHCPVVQRDVVCCHSASQKSCEKCYRCTWLSVCRCSDQFVIGFLCISISDVNPEKSVFWTTPPLTSSSSKFYIESIVYNYFVVYAWGLSLLICTDRNIYTDRQPKCYLSQENVIRGWPLIIQEALLQERINLKMPSNLSRKKIIKRHSHRKNKLVFHFSPGFPPPDH